MKYFRAFISAPIENHIRTTEKAIGFQIAGGYTDANDFIKWLPKSQIKIGKPNECNFSELLIPVWLLKKSNIDPRRIRDIVTENGVNPYIEM